MRATVSVVIPSYNSAAYLPGALASVRAQRRAADEIVVVDDGSSDDSRAIALEAGARVIETGTNAGPAAARNLGIAAAHGELIAFLDADDSWEPNHLAEVVPLLEENPIAALAFSRERRFGGWGGTHPRVLQPGRPVDGFWPVLRKNFIPQMGAVVRRDALIEVQGYDETMRYAEDYDLWLRLARRFPMICTDRVTCNHRGHPDQASARDDLLARGAYEARWHAWCAARVSDSPRVVQRIERIIRAAWNDYLWKVWRSRNRSLMTAALSLRQLVPGSHSIYRRWDRRARLLWPWYLRAARGWDRVVGNEKREAGSEKRA